jgi:acyl carrier protein
VTVKACDVSDRGALAALLAEYPVTAVFHLAGVAQRKAHLTVGEFAEVVRAKIAGAIHLDELLGDTPLFMFSSDATFADRSGQAAYASANAFLDGLAQRRRARGRPATSIAWGAWDSGLVDEKLSEYLRKAGTPPMRPETAIQALREILQRDEGNIIVANTELPASRENVAEPGDLVRTQVAAVLGYDDPAEIDQHRTFDDLGFDSIAVVDLRNQLSGATGRKLPTSMLYDHPTPHKLAEFLRKHLRQDTAVPVLAELDRFEQLVSTLPAEQIDSGRISARLQALATRLSQHTSSVDIGSRLKAASADDVLDFIDQELGLA